MPNILVIDHNEEFVCTLCDVIKDMGHRSTGARTLLSGIRTAMSEDFDVVFLNVHMPDGKGMDAISKILATHSTPEIIILTDSGEPDEAERAIKAGAWDYLERPSSTEAIGLSLARVLEYRARKVHKRPSMLLKKETFDAIVGSSPGIKSCLEHVGLAAGGDASILITGETGTGKELFARAIHDNSSRACGEFVVVDCAALPDSLVESTLFGYEKGAFTGAYQAREGLIKRADGGTLFLDEIGELPLAVQKKFLRVLQERSYRHVGGSQETKSDFRLIAATNRDLEAMVRRRQFRKDLLFRLRAFSLELPPLRERPEDISDIVAHHMGKLCRAYGIEEKQFSSDFLEVLATYSWPGNVRELVNALERAVSAARYEPVIFPKHLPTYIRIHLARASVCDENVGALERKLDEPSVSKAMPMLAEAREIAIAEAEQNYLRDLVSLTGGNVREAIRISGLSRSRLYALLKKYRIPCKATALALIP